MPANAPATAQEDRWLADIVSVSPKCCDVAATSPEPSLDALADLHEAYFRRLRLASLPVWLRLNVSVPQLRLLHLLVFDGPQLSGSLAQALGVTPSTVTGLCDRLLERGLVRREADPTDRRCTRVSATDKGHALVTEHFSSTREHLLRILENLSTPQQRAVGDSIAQWVARCNQVGLAAVEPRHGGGAPESIGVARQLSDARLTDAEIQAAQAEIEALKAAHSAALASMRRAPRTPVDSAPGRMR